MWRKPVQEQPPAHLLEFNPADWESSGYLGKSASQRWSDARYEWLLARKGKGYTLNGMDIIDVIFEAEG